MSESKLQRDANWVISEARRLTKENPDCETFEENIDALLADAESDLDNCGGGPSLQHERYANDVAALVKSQIADPFPGNQFLKC
ncbi:MAG: hypothetical protein KAJ19_29330 [Gammaproteobacteria bacterium]|nr:hypothetical protein [Gammaproteobacteria bacterium]